MSQPQDTGSTIVKVTAIVALAVIAVTALMRGIDSVLLSTISAIIGGIAGYEIRRHDVPERIRSMVKKR